MGSMTGGRSSEPRNLAWIRRYGLSEDLLLGWRDLSLEKSVK